MCGKGIFNYIILGNRDMASLEAKLVYIITPNSLNVYVSHYDTLPNFLFVGDFKGFTIQLPMSGENG